MRNKFFSNAVNLCYLAALFVLPMWLAGMLGFDVVSDITVAVAFIWAFLAYIFGGVPSHWSNPMRDGWPTAYYRSRRRPPWQFPREVNSSGSRTDRADYRLLEQRLVKIADLPSAPVGWSDVALFHDPISGQYWRRELHEAGFNQWHILIPVDRPDAGALGTAIGAPKSE